MIPVNQLSSWNLGIPENAGPSEKKKKKYLKNLLVENSKK